MKKESRIERGKMADAGQNAEGAAPFTSRDAAGLHASRIARDTGMPRKAGSFAAVLAGCGGVA